jgi:ribonuclease R
MILGESAGVAAAMAVAGNTPVQQVPYPLLKEKLVALKDYLATFGRKLAMGQVITPGLFNRMLKDVTDEAEKALVMEAVLRSQTQAYYGPRNAGHFGLALGSYAHFTSPIRRYSDLLVHRALVDSWHLEQPRPEAAEIAATSGLSDRDREDLARISEAISMAERRAMEAERETIDRYVAAWLSGRVGEVFDTRITGVQKFGLFATIIGLGGDGLGGDGLGGDGLGGDGCDDSHFLDHVFGDHEAVARAKPCRLGHPLGQHGSSPRAVSRGTY